MIILNMQQGEWFENKYAVRQIVNIKGLPHRQLPEGGGGGVRECAKGIVITVIVSSQYIRGYNGRG